MNGKLTSIISNLKEKSVDFELIELGKTTDQYEIFKTLIVKKTTGEYFAALLPVDRKIDLKKLEKRYASEVNLATHDEVKNITGVEPGAVCPLDLKMPLVIDDSMFRYKKISIGSGDLSYSLAIDPRSVLKLTGAKITKVT